MFILCSLTVVALTGDLSKSKYSSEIFKIKFDDHPDSIIYNKSLGSQFGCGADGRFYFKFDSESNIHKTTHAKVYYKGFGAPVARKELIGTFYKRNMQTGIFENINETLFDSITYYFWSDPVLRGGDYQIDTSNIEGQHREKTYYIHCPEFRYTCADIKPVIDCYNTKDEKLVIELSGMNIQGGEEFNLSDLAIYTKGTNERSHVLDNTLAGNATLEKIGEDKYRIISPLLYGNEKAGTNIINFVFFQPKNCFYDMYPDAYVTPKCDGIKEISSDSLSGITGAAVVETGNITNYWLYGISLLVILVLVVLLARRKKRI